MRIEISAKKSLAQKLCSLFLWWEGTINQFDRVKKIKLELRRCAPIGSTELSQRAIGSGPQFKRLARGGLSFKDNLRVQQRLTWEG